MILTSEGKALFEKLNERHVSFNNVAWECEQLARRLKRPCRMFLLSDSIHIDVTKHVYGHVDKLKELAVAMDEVAEIFGIDEHKLFTRTVEYGYVITHRWMKSRAVFNMNLCFNDMPQCRAIEVTESYTMTKYICS